MPLIMRIGGGVGGGASLNFRVLAMSGAVNVWAAGTAYTAGQYVLHDGGLYCCIADNTDAEWTDAHWLLYVPHENDILVTETGDSAGPAVWRNWSIRDDEPETPSEGDVWFKMAYSPASVVSIVKNEHINLSLMNALVYSNTSNDWEMRYSYVYKDEAWHTLLTLFYDYGIQYVKWNFVGDSSSDIPKSDHLHVGNGYINRAYTDYIDLTPFSKIKMLCSKGANDDWLGAGISNSTNGTSFISKFSAGTGTFVTKEIDVSSINYALRIKIASTSSGTGRYIYAYKLWGEP